MNKKIAGFLAAAFVGASIAMAGSPCSNDKDLKKIVDEGPYVQTSQKGVTLSGYVDAGYTYNFSGRGENIATSNRFGGDANNRGDFNLNAFKLVLEKALTDANELQAGFRADVMFGEDAAFLGQNAGGSDSVFLEQAYVQFRLPYGNGIDFKVGKMVTPLGYEVIERPVNMNITYGQLFSTLPLWHTGVMAAYKFNDSFDMQFGVVNGNNADNGVGADAEDNGMFIATANYTVPGGNANWYNGVLYGVNGDGRGAFDDSPLVIYDTWMNWVPKFAKDKLLLGANFQLGNGYVATDTTNGVPNRVTAFSPTNFGNLGVAGGQDDSDTTTWVGAAAYAKYQFTDIFSLAGRLDWLHNDDSNMFGNANNGTDPSFPNTEADGSEDMWSTTITAGFDLIENMMLRTEYRLDWGSDLMQTNFNGTGAAGRNSSGPLHTAAVQVVYSF
ncbi:MAG: outer membrane beta-barrel protein [bacterium]